MKTILHKLKVISFFLSRTIFLVHTIIQVDFLKDKACVLRNTDFQFDVDINASFI